MAVKTAEIPGIKGMLPMSMLDWEGQLVTTIFLGGCNLRCPFCHNAQLAVRANDLPDIPWDNIVEALSAKAGWVDGVCITGGEPTISNSLPEILHYMAALRLKVKLDTNGTKPQVLKNIIEDRLIHAVALDIKTSFDKYSIATRVPNISDSLKESIGLLIEAETKGIIETEFRTTVVPTIVERDDVLQIAKYLGGAGAKRYTLQQFNPKTVMEPSSGNIKPYHQDFMSELAQEASRLIPTQLRG